MGTAITRHFVTIDGRWGTRQVHYRRAGAGPAVLLLHQSPQSSREMLALMARWALHFTVIAPDTPGYGQSDALGPDRLSIADFAAALLEFANAAGLRRFGIYGYHTGASIGTWLAAAHPERVTAVAANGLAQFDDAERATILAKYLPPLVPSWDGAHLAWLWGRVREQTMFFPWHERSTATRMAFDVPDPERLQAGLVEFLRAGDSYAVAYRAAFESRPETLLPGLAVPLLVTAAAGDPLQAHFARYGARRPGMQVVPAESPAAALDLCLQHLLSHRGDECPRPVATRPVTGRPWNQMLALDGGQLRVRVELSGAAEPLLLLHDAGQSAAGAERLIERLLGSRPVVLPDLPGHGESDASLGVTVDAAAEAAAAALGCLGMSEAVLAGEGSGGCVALETARRRGARGARLALLDLPWLGSEQRRELREHGLPPIAPQWHGGHLLLAWHMLRDSRLFFPWFERNRRGVRRGAPDLDERRLQLELRDLLIAEGHWQRLRADALDYPIVESLRDMGARSAVGTGPDSPWREPTRAAAAAAGLAFRELPAAPAGWLPALLEGRAGGA